MRRRRNCPCQHVGQDSTQMVYRHATGWTVQGSKPGGARFSSPLQNDTGAHPASNTLSRAEVKERVEIYLY
jgi:hypothetical protein